MSDADKIKVFLCSDHFQRLCDGNTCETCPSRIENRDAVMAIAKLRSTEPERLDMGTIMEIRSVRRVVTDLSVKMDRIDEDLRGNGKPGMSTRLTLLETLVKELRKASLGRWMLAGQLVMLAAAVAAVVVAIVK